MVFNCKQFQVIQSGKVFKITTDASLLGALSLNNINDQLNLDLLEVGTGTGIISLMLAQRFQNANIDGIDINNEAVILSNINFQNSKYSDRLLCSLCGILEYQPNKKYDHIIINPPYFLNDTKSLDKIGMISRHMSDLTYESLVYKLASLLKADGSIHMIHPARYSSLIQDACETYELQIQKKVYIRHSEGKKVRNMITEIQKLNDRSLSERNFREVYFNLRNSDQSFSSEYINSLKDFLTIF